VSSPRSIPPDADAPDGADVGRGGEPPAAPVAAPHAGPHAGPRAEAAAVPLRDRLLAEAIAILSKDGGAALTVRRVAAAAGCSTIGVYTHFDGKSGLVDAVIQDGFDALDAAVARVDTVEGGIERLHAGAHAYRDWALANPTRYRVMFDALVPDQEWGGAAARRGGDSFAAHLARVDYAAGRGELVAADVTDLAHHVWACVHGHVLLQLLRGVRPADAEARAGFDQAVTWLFEGCRALDASQGGRSVRS